MSLHATVMCFKGRVLSPHGKVHGRATESTVEILYRLGTHQDDELKTRYDITQQCNNDSLSRVNYSLLQLICILSLIRT